jgi:D-glycero-D-manno-heptose 1,7-bisphosphate phosphatase
LIKAAFLDRDGVINRNAPEGDYILRWEDVELLPGAVEGISKLRQAGFAVIVVTNQRCVAKGLITAAELEHLHRRLTDSLTAAGAPIDAIYYCPHELGQSCECRKPLPGMLLAAAQERGIGLAQSWMIGDSDIDVEAGQRAGCKTARLVPAGGTRKSIGIEATLVAPSLLDAAGEIVRLEGISSDSAVAKPAAS